MSVIDIEDVLNNPFTQDLCVFDSVHDFWKERKKKKKTGASAGDDDDDDDDVDETLLKQTQDKLLKLINRKTNAKVNDIGQLIRNMTNRYVDNFNASKYERNVRAYYETNPMLSHAAEYLSYDDIIDNKGNWDKYLNGASTMISLEPGKKYSSFGAVMGAKKQNVVAEFLLRYLFSQTRDNVYLTFDAKTGIMRNIFRDLDQVYHLITPANIADSATTSFNRLHNGRNVFYFPKGNTFPFHSNFFTQNAAKMEITNNGFSDKNNYGFELRISPNTGAPIVCPFSAKQSSGPSVNYLVSLLLGNSVEKRNMVNIDEVKKHQSLINDGILFDLKRGGDYEQVNAAKIVSGDLGNVVLCTIDILCSVYARCIRQPVIRHYNDNLEIYRFGGEIAKDPEMGELIQLKFKVVKLIQSLTLVKNTIENQLVNELYDFQQKCVDFIDRGKLYFKQNLSFMRSGKTVEQSVAEKIGEEVLKNKLADILSAFHKINANIEEFKTQMGDVNVEMFAQDIAVLTQLIEVYNSSGGKSAIQSFIQTNNVYGILSKYEIQNVSGTKHGEYDTIVAINAFIQKLTSVLSLTNIESNILDNTKATLGLNVKIADTIRDELCFTLEGEIKSVKLHGNKYAEFADAFFKIHRDLERTRRPTLHNLMKEYKYNGYVEHIRDAYLSKSAGHNAYNILSPSDDSDAGIISWAKSLYSTMPQLKAVTQNSVKTKSLPKPEIPAVSPINTKAVPFGRKRAAEDTSHKTKSATKKRRTEAQPAKTAAKSLGKTAKSRGKTVKRRRGGDPTITANYADGNQVYQYFQLNDLLADISIMSASYLESVMTEYMKTHHKSTLLEKTHIREGGTVAPHTFTRKQTHGRVFKSVRKTLKHGRTKMATKKGEQSVLVSGFIDHLKEYHHQEISDLMEKLAYRFESEIVSMRNGINGLFTYRPSETDVFLICVLMMNRKASQENILLGMEQNTDLFGEMDLKDVKIRLNDVYAKYSLAENIPPEIINILVFTLIDNLMQTNKTGYFNTFIRDLVASLRQKQMDGRTFETKRDWEKVIDIVYVLIHCVSNNTFVPPREVIQLL